MKTKIAAILAASMVAASSFAFAADNGNNDGSNKDSTTTGSTRNSTGDIDDAEKCREGAGGGAPCQETGTEIQQ